jgi:hypothetical protein
MANVKDFTGSVNVLDGEVTPTTRQKIDKVTPGDWSQMDISTLWDERIVLDNRMAMAYQCGHAEIARQIQQGLNTIDALLRRKAIEAAEKDSELL